ncbi:MAG: hypothetical protein AAF560_16365 [Acidobacteriota bacterium]
MTRDPDRFETQFKAWATRPPATPADEAARQVLRRLPAARRSASRPVASRPGVPWLRLAAMAAAVVSVMTLGTRFFLREPAVLPADPEATVGLVEAPPVPAGVALIWLDSGTPLYLTLTPPAESNGGPAS